MFSSEMLEPLYKHLPQHSLQIFSESAWGSNTPHHRRLIREFLKAQLKGKIPQDEFLRLDDLETPPRFAEVFCSISHTGDFGMVALSQFPVGIDVEIKDRVREPIVARVSSPQEIQEAPSIAHLWSAKEAAYKSLLSFAQPSVISAVSIGGWRKIDSHAETFVLLSPWNFNAPSQGVGICLQNNVASLAIFGFFS